MSLVLALPVVLLAQAATRLWRTPGRARQTLAESSFDAWIKFYRADENTPNSQISCKQPATNNQGNATILLKGVLKGASGKYGKVLDVNKITQASPFPPKAPAWPVTSTGLSTGPSAPFSAGAASTEPLAMRRQDSRAQRRRVAAARSRDRQHDEKSGE